MSRHIHQKRIALRALKSMFADSASIRRLLSLVTLAALLLPMMSLSVRSSAAGKGDAGPATNNRNGAPEDSIISPLFPPTVLVPAITATKTDALLVDNNGNNQADGGDTLKYTVTITNGGSMDATDVTFNDTIDPNTTLVPGSVMTTPVARDDSYAATGNVQISIGAGSGLLANDSDADFNPLTASAGATSTQGGNVSVSSDGSFTYNPPPGFEGADSFSYTINDGTGGTDTATATINVSGMIWFVNAGAGAGGDGRLTSPFNALTGAGSFDAVAADDANDNIFLYSGNYTGGLTLLAGQKLIGQGATVSLAQVTGLTPPTGSLALPSTGGANPVITTAAAGTNGINLGANNLLRGLTVGDTTGAGINGSGFGTLTVREMSVNGDGQALNLNTGALDANFNELASNNSGAAGVSLSGVSGTLSSGTTDIQNPVGVGLQVSGSDAALDFGDTVANGSGGTGVVLSGNTGDISFADLDIAPDAGQRALLANANSTGTITATSGTLAGVNAPAIEINGISPANRTNLNLTFDSVSSSNAASGISLSSTDGAFAVNGTAATAGSGGTISNITNRGASFIDANGITLRNMNFTNVGTVNGDDPTNSFSTCGGLENGLGGNLGCNAGIHLVNVTGATFSGMNLNGGVQQGINGNNVNGFDMSDSSVTNFGDETGEDGLRFKNLLGNAAMSNTIVTGNEAAQLRVLNTLGTLTAFNVTGSTFSNSAAPNGSDGIRFVGTQNAQMSISVQNSTMSSNAIDGFSSNGTDTANVAVAVSGSTIQNNANSGISVIAVSGASGTFTITNNPTITDSAGNAININLATPSTGTLQGTISGNVIGTTSPGSGSAFGDGIRILSNGAGAVTAAVTDNTVQGITFGNGISASAQSGSSALNVTITGNTIDLNSNFSTTGIFSQSGATSSDTTSVCADIGGAGALANTIANTAGGDGIRVRNRFAGTTFRLPGFVGSGTSTTDVINYLIARNNNSDTTTATRSAPNIFAGGAACTSPIASLQRPEINRTNYTARLDGRAPFGKRNVLAGKNRNRAASTMTASRNAFASVAPAKTEKRARPASALFGFNHAVSKNAGRISARPAASFPLPSGESISLNIGTLPAGKSVTIMFQVTLNASAPVGVNSVSNQGAVSGSNFGTVLTDDPDTGAPNDPTVTPANFTTAPTISCPSDIVVNTDPGACNASVAFSATATGNPAPTIQYKIGATVITSPHTFPTGTTTVTATATNGVSPDASCSFTVTVNDAEAPVITLNGANPLTVECHTSFTDPGATATDNCGSIPVNASGTVNTNVPGTYIITYTASDSSGNAATPVMRTVNVVDTTQPVINLNGQSPTMWPANHKYQTFTIQNFVTSVTDGCNTSLNISSVVIAQVTSDEVENGNGDGNTLHDIVIAADCKSVQLRAERDGSDNGRVYTITFSVRDSQGNIGTATARVTVPKSQGNGGAAVDSGPHYTVNGTCP